MDRTAMINRVGINYHTSNIEGGEYSYVLTAGSKDKLEKAVGHKIHHFKLDIRFEYQGVVLLIETKQKYVEKDIDQLREYLEEEKAINNSNKVICILANTNNNDIRVWKNIIDDGHELLNETVLDTMEHYEKLFDINKQNDRELVLKNTYALNELLHKKDIDEVLRSQFVGTTLLYIKSTIKDKGTTVINNALVEDLNSAWKMMGPEAICAAIRATLNNMLNGSDNKAKKIELLQKHVLDNQKVKNLSINDWIEILDTIILDIYRYIDADSSEGQDILNLFFIAFNKYTGKADKNQAFTPDHITDFMCRITEVDRTKVVFDGTCGSGSFLVQALVKELADCRRGKTEADALELMKEVKEKHIYGVEVEDKAYGLSTTNMLIHGDGNSNIKYGDLFKSESFIREANPDIILMNPPYNAKPKSIPDSYKTTWNKKAKDGKEDPTKGFVFVRYISDVIQKMNDERESSGKPRKEVKMAVLLPVSAAIGTSQIIEDEKTNMLKCNTLEAVFTLPNEIFYPGASASACCMLFTLGRPHVSADGSVKKTFFGYYKDDGHKKKKNLGRIEQFDKNNNSLWKQIEDNWISMYKNMEVVDGLSSTAVVDASSEWLCEAYMKTDYTKLKEKDFQDTINNYLAYLVREGNVYET